jgi:hypothetical protein
MRPMTIRPRCGQVEMTIVPGGAVTGPATVAQPMPVSAVPRQPNRILFASA